MESLLLFVFRPLTALRMGSVHRVRVLSGAYKGRKIKAPSSKSTRPTSARVKKSLFDMLEARADLHGFSVLDLFAGSGALGIEAISRGATEVIFVDNASRTLKENMDLIRADTADVRVVRNDALAYLKSAAAGGVLFDLIFLDPPYAFSNWPELLQLSSKLLSEESYLVIESDQEVQLPDSLRLEKLKSYGSTVVMIAAPAQMASDEHRFEEDR